MEDLEACAQLSTLLAYRQTGALLSSRLMVYPFNCQEGENVRIEQDHQLAA